MCNRRNGLGRHLWLTLLAALGYCAMSTAADASPKFRDGAARIFEAKCVRCHNETEKKGELSLQTAQAALAGGESGRAFEPGAPNTSLLIEYISGKQPEMPKDDKPLSKDEVDVIRQWIADGAQWPQELRLADKSLADLNWWSLRPLNRPEIPSLSADDALRVRTPVDAFILDKLHEHGLSFSPEADRRTLIRRLYFDLIGLPPTPDEIDQFVADDGPLAYERLVERLLASPRHGERWARHWLDVVHYGDTHGYDKDKLRENAWPYRDYVIRAFNADKPYERFVQEQIAGDVLWPNTTDGVVATGFLAAGPWDFIGHAEVPESKIDGKVARHVDRDDMVRTVFESFNSLTVGCAQCHNHKFDPVTMEDYYRLHAVFAAIDRADRPYEPDPAVAQLRSELAGRKQTLETERTQLEARVAKSAGPKLAELNRRIADLQRAKESAKKEQPEFGYHSNIEKRADVGKWVQVDLGRSVQLAHVVLVGCHDSFNSIGAGFGFPVRFKIEASDDAEFKTGVFSIADHTGADVANPGVTPQSFPAGGKSARYVRVTATKLVNRLPADYILALAELMALSPDGKNKAQGATVTSLDSIEAPVRWRRSNLVDGYYYGVWEQLDLGELAKLGEQRQAILESVLTAELRAELARLSEAVKQTDAELKALPAGGRVYAGCVHHGEGNFRGRGGLGPREIFVLHRGQVTQPGERAMPGTLRIIPQFAGRFDLSPHHDEGERRAALAKWLTRADHPLTWRSIVNRVWHYHFGRGIVDSPNDFGRMGQKPTHPELLDWLAAEFRDNGQSIKDLHRLIVNSTTYRQVSTPSQDSAIADRQSTDADNRLLGRMNPRKLEAEAIRDTVLYVAGKLDLRMHGPGFRDFVLEKPEHSPHYEYDKYDVNDPATHRRSVYRFLVRSQPQPLMTTLDCADPSQIVGRRNETITALQALSLLNNRFIVRMSDHFADRLAHGDTSLSTQVASGFRTAVGRVPTVEELELLTEYAREHGLASACRLILNLNEFAFVD